MKICDSCRTTYDAQATYCNICDIDLDNSNTTKKDRKLSQEESSALGLIKLRLIKIHQFLGGVQAIFLLLVLYSIGFSEGLGAIIPVVIMFSFPILHFCTARGVRYNKSWAHTSSMIIGGLLLVAFPVGTIFGFLILINLFRKEWDLIREK